VPDSGRAGLFGTRQLCHFFTTSDRGLLEVRGATIHPTEDAERRTQPRGQFFCVRAWDSTLLNRLGRMSRCSMYVARAETAPAEASLGPGSFCFARPLVGWDGVSVAQLHAHTCSPAVAALISSARGSLWSALAFAAAICLLLMLGFAVWVRMPLQRIARSLTAGRADRLGSLGRSRTEFGDIARLVASFFEQRKELEVHRSNLEQLVEQRTVELRIAHEDLLRKERLAALGQVAGSIAHEIRNPLGAIRNAVYYLQRLSDQPLTGKAARHLTIIEREIQHANAVVSSLLEFARGRRCEPADCQVRDIIAGTLARLDVPAGISVELAVAPDLGPVRADPVQMSVVFQNLIANAVDALNGSGRVRIAADRRGDSVQVSITDNGPGIGMAHLPRLFEPLFSTKAFGVGLGLPIAKSYVEANGGSIRIDSEVGKGTTALVSLPAAQPEPAAKS
jgi:signal transduction histidine kinase